jgi:hypothetical protein
MSAHRHVWHERLTRRLRTLYACQCGATLMSRP